MYRQTMLYLDLIEATETHVEAISWARSRRLIHSALQCACCHIPMMLKKFDDAPDFEAFRCPKCHIRRSIRTGSAFARSKIPLRKILLLIYLWIKDGTVRDISREMEISGKTTLQCFSNLRRLVVEHTSQAERASIIGGPGMIVELDESIVSKRKYNRGRLVREQWVFGGIQRSTSVMKPFFMELVPNRRETTLLEIIGRRVAAGTTIMTDGWRSYRNLSRYNGYNHCVVNHSVNLVDRADRNVHTQNVENQWMHLKAWLKKKGSNLGPNISEYLFEYWFKRKNNDAFDAIISILSLQLAE
jgi:transposase-like protein